MKSMVFFYHFVPLAYNFRDKNEYTSILHVYKLIHTHCDMLSGAVIIVFSSNNNCVLLYFIINEYVKKLYLPGKIIVFNSRSKQRTIHK